MGLKPRFRQCILESFTSIVTLLFLSLPARAQVYNISDLGSLGGVRGSGAYGLNGFGVSVGYSFVAGSNLVHAMINDHGTVLDLGTLGGTQSLARAVNSNGDVVGWAYQPGLTWQRAFLWRAGVMTDLGTFGGSIGDAHAINEAGIIVGSASDPENHERGFWWKDGVLHDIGTLGGSGSRVLSINASGDMTGWASTPGDDGIHAFLSKPGSPLYDLGTLGGPVSYGWGVNNQVHLCGWSEIQSNNPASRGFFWADGVMKSLGTLGGIYSAAFALNDYDQLVGASTRGDEVQDAVLWASDKLVDLNTLIPAGTGWHLVTAWDIDNNGVIVGEGIRSDGTAHGFLLTPVSSTDVPRGSRVPHLAFMGAQPNPLTTTTWFVFELPTPGRASITVLDVSGRTIRTLCDGWVGPGLQRATWDARDVSGVLVPPGVYWARLRACGHVLTRTLAVVR